MDRRAADDLLAIGDFIAADDSGAARGWVERLRRQAVAAGKAPGAGRMVPELNREDIREVLLRSYRIVYRVLPDEIVVLTTFEGHRTLGDVGLEDQ